MATQTIPRRTSNRNTATQARRAEILRMVEVHVAQRLAADDNRGIICSTVYQTTDPGPDYTPRAWR